MAHWTRVGITERRYDEPPRLARKVNGRYISRVLKLDSAIWYRANPAPRGSPCPGRRSGAVPDRLCATLADPVDLHQVRRGDQYGKDGHRQSQPRAGAAFL